MIQPTVVRCPLLAAARMRRTRVSRLVAPQVKADLSATRVTQAQQVETAKIGLMLQWNTFEVLGSERAPGEARGQRPQKVPVQTPPA